MASTKGTGAPASFAEGANGIVQAISATMTAPDAGPHLQLLEGLLKAMIGALQKGASGQAGQPPPGGAPGGPPGAPPGGGTNIGSIMGQPQGGPAGANPAAPPAPGVGGGPSATGASADDMRRMMASSAATAG